MKKVFALFLTLLVLVQVCPLSVMAVDGTAYYIDSVLGDDANVGTSPEKAWKSVSRIPSYSLRPGDQVLFRRGGEYLCSNLTFVCSGTKENPILISSYGSAESPLPLLYTMEKEEIFRFFDCDYITVSNLEMTAHNGGGIWIDTLNKISRGMTLDGLVIHDIQNVDQKDRDCTYLGAAGGRACVMVKGLPARSEYPVHDLTIQNCEMYDCGNGISLWGSWNTGDKLWFYVDRSVPPVYNENALIQNVYFHDMTAEAVIMGICKDSLVTHCRAIDCCLDEGVDEETGKIFMNAAMWFWGSLYSTMEYCEIAGQKNKGDGMAVDFDSYTNYCTYQYIYSHDNNAFMCNNAKDDPQIGNTVRYCLSVNDNALRTRFSTARGEEKFRFYNNTVVNCGDINLSGLHDATIVNNIFTTAKGCTVNSDWNELMALGKWGNVYKNNCYYNFTTPLVDSFSMNTLPGFVGEGDFRLAKGSKLLGTGTKVEDELETDFFGNPIASNNIGCYAGEGVDVPGAKVRENVLRKCLRKIVGFWYYLLSVLRGEKA